MPEEGVQQHSHADVLRYEELLRLVRITAACGIRNVKVTGGEPLIRKGCTSFLRELKAIPGVENVTLTTNGVFLEAFLDELVKIKIDGVNISLDSLSPEKYKQITGRDDFAAVWRGLEMAVEAGLPVKVNCVPIAELNEGEITDFARLSERMPVDVRFIELMPTTAKERFTRVGSEAILARLTQVYPDLTQDTRRRGFGPSRYYKSSKMQGSIGIIDAIGGCFCPNCNRVRLTSDGFLKLCLFHDDGLDLREMMRNGASDSEILEAFVSAVFCKPEEYARGDSSGVLIKNMSQIGG